MCDVPIRSIILCMENIQISAAWYGRSGHMRVDALSPVAPLAERKAFQAARQAKYEEALGAVAGDAAMQQPQLEEAGSLLDLESQSGRV